MTKGNDENNDDSVVSDSSKEQDFLVQEKIGTIMLTVNEATGGEPTVEAVERALSKTRLDYDTSLAVREGLKDWLKRKYDLDLPSKPTLLAEEAEIGPLTYSSAHPSPAPSDFDDDSQDVPEHIADALRQELQRPPSQPTDAVQRGAFDPEPPKKGDTLPFIPGVSQMPTPPPRELHDSDVPSPEVLDAAAAVIKDLQQDEELDQEQPDEFPGENTKYNVPNPLLAGEAASEEQLPEEVTAPDEETIKEDAVAEAPEAKAEPAEMSEGPEPLAEPESPSDQEPLAEEPVAEPAPQESLEELADDPAPLPGEPTQVNIQNPLLAEEAAEKERHESLPDTTYMKVAKMQLKKKKVKRSLRNTSLTSRGKFGDHRQYESVEEAAKAFKQGDDFAPSGTTLPQMPSVHTTEEMTGKSFPHDTAPDIAKDGLAQLDELVEKEHPEPATGREPPHPAKKDIGSYSVPTPAEVGTGKRNKRPRYDTDTRFLAPPPDADSEAPRNELLAEIGKATFQKNVADDDFDSKPTQPHIDMKRLEEEHNAQKQDAAEEPGEVYTGRVVNVEPYEPEDRIYREAQAPSAADSLGDEETRRWDSIAEGTMGSPDGLPPAAVTGSEEAEAPQAPQNYRATPKPKPLNRSVSGRAGKRKESKRPDLDEGSMFGDNGDYHAPTEEELAQVPGPTPTPTPRDADWSSTKTVPGTSVPRPPKQYSKPSAARRNLTIAGVAVLGASLVGGVMHYNAGGCEPGDSDDQDRYAQRGIDSGRVQTSAGTPAGDFPPAYADAGSAVSEDAGTGFADGLPSTDEVLADYHPGADAASMDFSTDASISSMLGLSSASAEGPAPSADYSPDMDDREVSDDVSSDAVPTEVASAAGQQESLVGPELEPIPQVQESDEGLEEICRTVCWNDLQTRVNSVYTPSAGARTPESRWEVYNIKDATTGELATVSAIIANEDGTTTTVTHRRLTNQNMINLAYRLGTEEARLMDPSVPQWDGWRSARRLSRLQKAKQYNAADSWLEANYGVHIHELRSEGQAVEFTRERINITDIDTTYTRTEESCQMAQSMTAYIHDSDAENEASDARAELDAPIEAPEGYEGFFELGRDDSGTGQNTRRERTSVTYDFDDADSIDMTLEELYARAGISADDMLDDDLAYGSDDSSSDTITDGFTATADDFDFAALSVEQILQLKDIFSAYRDNLFNADGEVNELALSLMVTDHRVAFMQGADLFRQMPAEDVYTVMQRAHDAVRSGNLSSLERSAPAAEPATTMVDLVSYAEPGEEDSQKLGSVTDLFASYGSMVLESDDPDAGSRAISELSEVYSIEADVDALLAAHFERAADGMDVVFDDAESVIIEEGYEAGCALNNEPVERDDESLIADVELAADSLAESENEKIAIIYDVLAARNHLNMEAFSAAARIMNLDESRMEFLTIETARSIALAYNGNDDANVLSYLYAEINSADTENPEVSAPVYAPDEFSTMFRMAGGSLELAEALSELRDMQDNVGDDGEISYFREAELSRQASENLARVAFMYDRNDCSCEDIMADLNLESDVDVQRMVTLGYLDAVARHMEMRSAVYSDLQDGLAEIGLSYDPSDDPVVDISYSVSRGDLERIAEADETDRDIREGNPIVDVNYSLSDEERQLIAETERAGREDTSGVWVNAHYISDELVHEFMATLYETDPWFPSSNDLGALHDEIMEMYAESAIQRDVA